MKTGAMTAERTVPDGQDDFLTLSPPSPGTFSFGQVQCV